MNNFFSMINKILDSMWTTILLNIFVFVLFLAGRIFAIMILEYIAFILSIFYIIFSKNRILFFASLIPIATLTDNLFQLAIIHILAIELLFVLMFFILKYRYNFITGQIHFEFLIIIFSMFVIKIINECFYYFSNGTFDAVGLIRDFLYYILFYIIYIYLKESFFSFEKAFFTLLLTFFISSCTSFIMCFNLEFREIICNIADSTYSAGAIGTQFRFSGLTWDPNHFSIYAIFFDLIFIVFLEKIKYKKTLVTLLLAINIITIFSGSKMFLLSIILLMFSLYCNCIIKYKKKVVLILSLSFICCAIFFVIFGQTAFEFIENRFLNTWGSLNILDSITTGRYFLFKSYNELIFKNPLIFLFGLNFGNYYVDGHAIHNTLQYYLYNYGVFVTIGIAYIFWNFLYGYFFVYFKKRNLFNCFSFGLIIFVCIFAINLTISYNSIFMFLCLFNFVLNDRRFNCFYSNKIHINSTIGKIESISI